MKEAVSIKTGHPEFDELYPRVKSFLDRDRLDVVIDGQEIRGYRSPDAKSIWIRDYSDMLRAVKYFEPDLKSAIDHFAVNQADNGRIFDYFTTFPEKLPSERENWTKYVRVPVEADVEFRFVKAAYLAWQATGDDDWISGLLPRMEKALQYTLTHPWRWDEKLGLVKRAYTIDTWDFAYTAGKHDWLQFQIDQDTFWGIMHGDNSGYYEAFKIMACLYAYFGNTAGSEAWTMRAEDLKLRLNAVCWNGAFYTHFVASSPVEIKGLDAARQLSLSNPMNVNRGTATTEMAASIIREYQKRGAAKGAFAEWFSIDPPFPDGIFGDEKLIGGAYVNGGIMPLVGGELARAAFDNGFEKYGVEILRKYFQMISQKGETYLWYFPDGTPASIETSTSPEAEPTDGWGSSAMLYALIEGLAGVEDRGKSFNRMRLAPRWAAADVDRAEVAVSYTCSAADIFCLYKREKNSILLDVSTPDSEVEFHVLIPEQASTLGVTINGENTRFREANVLQSVYCDFEARGRRFDVEIKLH